jgi:hypothetical protein
MKERENVETVSTLRNNVSPRIDACRNEKNPCWGEMTAIQSHPLDPMYLSRRADPIPQPRPSPAPLAGKSMTPRLARGTTGRAASSLRMRSRLRQLGSMCAAAPSEGKELAAAHASSLRAAGNNSGRTLAHRHSL